MRLDVDRHADSPRVRHHAIPASYPCYLYATGKWRIDGLGARGTGICAIRPGAARRPMLPSPKLSALTGAEVHGKYENLQVTNSFKDRGALNKLASLDAAARARGVIAMSAGNHAQAVAYHAARLGIPATIVMPVHTPFVKVEATQAHGAEVVLEGESVA